MERKKDEDKPDVASKTGPGRSVLAGDAAPLCRMIEAALGLLDNGDLDGNGVLESAFKTLVLGLLMPEVLAGTLRVASEERVRKTRADGTEGPGYVDLVLSGDGAAGDCLVELKYLSLGYLRDGTQYYFRNDLERMWMGLRGVRDRLAKESEEKELLRHRFMRKDDNSVLRKFAYASKTPYSTENDKSSLYVFPASLLVEQAMDQLEHYEPIGRGKSTAVWKLVLVGVGARVVSRWVQRIVVANVASPREEKRGKEE
jgi:hypothetical protein